MTDVFLYFLIFGVEIGSLDDPTKRAKAILPSTFTADHAWGNWLADQLATKAASSCQLPYGIVKAIKFQFYLVRRIQLRIIAIIKSMPPRPKVSKPVVPLSVDVDPLEILLKQSNHSIEIVDQYAQCRGCFARSKLKNAKEWITAPCPKIFIPNPDFVHTIYATMPIGNRNIHSSHCTALFRGFSASLRFNQSASE